MPGAKIAETDHLSRLCPPSKCSEGGAPQGAAFMLRPDKEDYLSTNWLEATNSTLRDDQLAIVRNHLSAKGVRLPATGCLAVIQIANAFSHIKTKTEDSRSLSAHHEPILPDDPSHAGIYGYDETDDLIADLLAFSIVEVYPARQPND